jgi:ribose transport system permease protein
VILAGGIDLAVGSILALAAVMFAKLSIHWGWSGWISVPTCVLIGAACGLASGALNAFVRMQAFVATLAMMVFARGLAKTASGGMKVSTAVQQADGSYKYVDAPSVFRGIDSYVFGDHLSVVTIIFIVCAVTCFILLRQTRWGRRVYAVGGNEEGARLSGIGVIGTKLSVFAMSGAFAAIAGLCQAAQELQGDPEAGVGYELTAIAAVVVGGTSLMGGRGGVGLTVIGTLIIGYIEKILSINAVSEANRLMLTGLIIVVSVAAQRLRSES